jgi:hypothetical protein
VLPFVQPPAANSTRRIGNEQCGIIEMVVRGGLTVTESDLISDLQAEHTSSLEVGAKLAEAIAATENITITEAFDIVQAAVRKDDMEPEARAIMLRHAAEIASIVKLLQRNGRLSTHATVTALIRTRCNRPEWSHADTLALDSPIFDGIWQLALDEQSAENMPSSPPTEDELKKPPQDNAPTPKPRGTKSSGS